MKKKKYFSYIRVSTQKQGQFGTSLAEQKAAIENYAQRFNLDIVKWFEERETAAKNGRPVFLEMIKELRRGNANGVVIHKIDRSARNLKDWAEFQSLTDSGIEIYFAAESLDLNSRSGRLSADIQAVVASDYIRNLREETIKGLYGRLKQGLFPFPAPVGYLNAGKGNPKKVDPVQSRLVKQAFELYATGDWGLAALADEMYERGLRTNRGRKISLNGISSILHNPFYIGLIKIEKTGEMFMGKHRPIISKVLFDQVQDVFEGKNIKKTLRHFFVFRRQVYCGKCRNFFIAEKQKGHIYYRCHTKNCTRGTVKETVLEKEVIKTMKKLELSDFEYDYFKQEIIKLGQRSEADFDVDRRRLQMLEEQIRGRLSKLADAYVDEVFDKETYTNKKNELLLEEQSIKEKMRNLRHNSDEAVKQLESFLELVRTAYLSYKWGTPEERRDLVKTVLSNCEIFEKKVVVKPYLPFQLILERPGFTYGSPGPETSRTLGALIKKLFNYFSKLDASKSDNNFLYYLNSKPEKKYINNFPKFNQSSL
jgi:site-specific DNA recombinase